ncbi:helix-turn-helix domain-containing protein [Nocardioides ferulae]|uniref:helix-turn-helix domain-containing protein n=1 Tax=Nocardioides ferulae TaxID=2340821 RepID=UPI001F0B7586|nr:helix-turn-helix domain-containing protein [Nocardioides ferulae]
MSPHDPRPDPHPALRGHVVSLTAYDVDLGGPGVHRGLPGTTLTLVLPVGEPLDVGWSGDDASRAARWGTLAGLHTGPAAIHHLGHQAGVQLELTVTGARTLLGAPAASLAGTIVDLEDAAPALRHLPERLAAAPAASRRAVVERALLGVLRDRPSLPRAEVAWALRQLRRGAGVGAVAAEVGLSRRHLGTLVRRECGVSARDLRRLGRFEQARALVGRIPLAEAAYRSGFADQAHLSREWSALAGCTPSTWLREEFPFVQDRDADSVPG